MAIGEILSPLTALVRFIFAIFRLGAKHPTKKLEARLIMRGIVSEIPSYVPFYICDETGERHKGIYVIGLLIWNKGTLPITRTDLIPSASLEVRIGADAALVGTRTVPVEEQTVCAATAVNRNTVAISFDCINPNEYLVVTLCITGNPMTEVEITGRIVGQENPIDHTAAEVKASIGERFAAFLALAGLMNMIPGFFIGGWLILNNYGLSTLWQNSRSIPSLLFASFTLGAMLLFAFAFSRAMYWNERRKYPGGYPLLADLEPPLLENMRGMMRTLFQGKKQRISISLFDWGKPIVMPSKNVRRPSIDDWIQ